MAKSERTRSKKNNNPTGRNQYSGGVIDLAREQPIAAAAVAAGAAVTGLFLWSKRAQITDQINMLSDQITEWSDGMRTGNANEFATSTGTGAFVGATGKKGRTKGKSQTQIAEEALTLKQTGDNL